MITERRAGLTRSLRLEYLTVGWNVVEAAVAIGAAVVAGSSALLAFGGDSVVESLSGAVLIWRLLAERRGADPSRVEVVERRARRGVAVSLWVLAGFVAAHAAAALVGERAPDESPVGMVLAVLSIGVMLWLAHRKRIEAAALHSHALEADATQTAICWKLSVLLLAGLGLNAALGWWWADPLAGLAMAGYVAWEGRNAWADRDCCVI